MERCLLSYKTARGSYSTCRCSPICENGGSFARCLPQYIQNTGMGTFFFLCVSVSNGPPPSIAKKMKIHWSPPHTPPAKGTGRDSAARCQGTYGRHQPPPQDTSSCLAESIGGQYMIRPEQRTSIPHQLTPPPPPNKTTGRYRTYQKHHEPD